MTTLDTPCRRASLVLTAVLAIILVTAFAAPSQAQVVSDPRIAEFDPSPDHWQTLDSGQPAVVRYELGVYMCGASAPFTTVDMGKPSPESDGKIRFDFSSSVTAWPLPGGNYEARVSAIGPEGAAPSEPSNPFTFSTGNMCTFSLSALSFDVPAAGGSYGIDVTTGATCPWIVTTAASWVTLWTSGSTGGGSVPFGVQANTSTTPRTGTLVVAGQSVTISQAAAAPTAKTTPTLTWPAPAAITQGTALSSTQLNATSTVPGTFIYDPAAGTMLAAGTHTLRVTFTPADTTLYNTATASTTLTVRAATYTLAVTRPSGGTVTGPGINCGTAGTACSTTLPSGTTVGVQATADTGYSFSGWTGQCSGTSASLSLQVNGDISCGAAFTAVSGSNPSGPSAPPPDDSVLPLGAPYTLTVTQPTGGTVKSAGINCGTKSKSCTVTMPGPMTLGLQATADAGYTFLNWSGHCSGTSPSYALALEGPRTCTANFIPAGSTVIQPPPDTTLGGTTGDSSGGTTTDGSLPMGAPYTLTVTRPIGGTVNAAGIDCGTKGKQCSVTMPAALWLGLQATPDRGYVFTGWMGHCNGTQPSYSLALEGPRTCGAVFTAK
jgi:hypothetical protein